MLTVRTVYSGASCAGERWLLMGKRAAIVTGGSGGIGLAVARVLASEGYALTLTARRPEKLAAAADSLREEGADVLEVAADLRDADTVGRVLQSHEERFGRLDVLVNNAGLGIGAAIDDVETKHLDLQLEVNLRSMILFYRDAMPMLRRAGAEHGNATVINMSSISGKYGTRGLSVYSATKHGMVGFTQAMNSELHAAGIKSCVLCPAHVDTELSEYIKDRIPPSEMIRVSDIAEAVRALLHMSMYCVIPEIVFARPGAMIQD
jgi:NAD(P)-dependent dehydrogenase (short-subunit alcohol dehydrogenase family)